MPIAPSPINEQVVREAVVRAVQGVFRTMIGKEAVLVSVDSTPTEPDPGQPAQILGSVGFVGEANGLVYLRLDEAFAGELTGLILGMSPAEVEMSGVEVVNDAIGEVTNMTVGGFKNALCDLGHPCKLTLPTIVRGRQISIAAVKAATRHILRFETGGQSLTVDIQLKQD